MKDILDNPGWEWEWVNITCNPNITMKDILDNPTRPWNWNSILLKSFRKEKEDFIKKAYRRHLAALRIQNAYRNALVNPYCQVGINRIERDMAFAGINV